MEKMLRLGTRGSKLALAQVELVRPLIAAIGLEIEPVIIRTSGDNGDREKLGAFVGELQQALLRREIDVALHCLKDLPTLPIPGLRFTAFLEREDPRDLAIVREGTWSDLKQKAVVGTGALRRTAQIRAVRPDLQFKPLVGNVDTRLEKLRRGEYDAIVLAFAGLRRLRVLDAISYEILPDQLVVPSAGQGILVLETRDEGSDLAVLDHYQTRQAAIAERAFLGAFGTGCSLPIGALATLTGDQISLHGRIVAPDGTRMIEEVSIGPAIDAMSIGSRLAETLILRGGRELLGGTA